VDVALAVLLAGAGVVDGLAPGDFPRPGPGTAVLMGLAGAAQVLRRLRPLSACAVTFAAMGAVALLFGHYESGVAILIALVAAYSAVVYGGDRRVVAVVLAGYAAALNLGQPFGEAVGDVLFTLAALGLVVAAGLAVRTWQDRAALSQLHADEQRVATARGAAEDERRRIARELHDILSHSLGVVMLQTGAADVALDRDPVAARAAVRAARATAEEAIGELQTLVRVVRAAEPEGRSPQPTLADLGHLVEQTRAAGLAVDLLTEGEPRPVAPALQASVYRIAQEGLANVVKHAGGCGSVLALRYRPGEVEIEVSNGAAGTGGQGPGSRLGLVGVRERVRVFGGRVEAGPGSAGGWDLRAVFPLP
jgi:signal transduction histidine kinase